MKAIIRKIELKKMLNKYYLKVTMESQGKEYVLSNPLLGDPINFRKQVFGILSACDCYDIMKLGRENPTPQPATGYYFENGGYKIFENKIGQWFLFNNKVGRYSCEKADEDIKKLIQKAQEYNISTVTVNKGTIESITSRSGVFNILFQAESGIGSCFTTGQVYWGFGAPINIGNQASESEKMESAKNFTSFIVNIMKFCRADDLLKLGGEVEKYPEVEMALNHSNKVTSITNSTTGLGLGIEKNYEILDFSKARGKERND